VLDAPLQRQARGLRQPGGRSRADLRAGEDGKEVGDVAVAHVGLGVVLLPLEEPAVVAGPRRRHPGLHRGDLLPEGGVLAQDLRRAQECPEQLVEDLAVHGRRHADRRRRAVLEAVRQLGRQRRPREQAALVVLVQVVHEEGRALREQRVGPAAEELLVAAEAVVLPQMECEPRGAHGPHEGAVGLADHRRVGEAVQVVVRHEAAAPVQSLRRRPAVGGHAVDEVEERLVALRKVADLGRPVVHLRVDVDGVLALPGRDEALVPDPLEIGRQRPWAAGGDKQVAAELEVEGHQRGVLGALLHPLQPLVGRQAFGLGRAPQIESHAAEEATVVSGVIGPELLERLR